MYKPKSIHEAIENEGWYWFECYGSDPEKYICEVSGKSVFIDGHEIDADDWEEAIFYGPITEPEWSRLNV